MGLINELYALEMLVSEDSSIEDNLKDCIVADIKRLGSYVRVSDKRTIEEVMNVWKNDTMIRPQLKALFSGEFKEIVESKLEVLQSAKSSRYSESKPKPEPKSQHYKKHKSGIECIDVVQHMNFNRGNAIKYIWRAGLKNDTIEDLKKAIDYLNYEIERVKKEKS